MTLFPADAAELWHGANPELSWSESNDFAARVAELDLGGLAGFLPGSLDDFAVLEDVGFAAADSGDLLVVAVGHGAFLYAHDDNGTRGDLDEFATFGGTVRLV